MPADARNDLLDRLVARIEHELTTAIGLGAGGVYAVALLLAFDDELHAPPLELAWNTDRRFADVDAAAKGQLPLNSRWNSGTWAEDGRRIDDDESYALATQALADCGFGDPQPDRFSDEGGERWVEMHTACARFIGDLARALHERGTLTRTLGHEVLVLCHTGSDSEPWTRLTLDANPSELHGDFLDFHEIEGVHDETF